jgi:CheY-like chemotaxis protein
VQALTVLLKSLLDLSRFEAGAVTARPSSVALGPLLERATGDETESARRQGISLRVRAPRVDVHSDPVLLEQILRNLVGNAVRYTRRGGVLVSARRRGADRLLLQVWDTGPGIPSESQVRVFDEFVQLDNVAAEAASGLGLGLSLVQRAAAVQGLCVTLRSAVGKGSCFSIDVPLAASVSVPDEQVTADGVGFEGRNLWVVEDDPDVRGALGMRLTGWGARVRAFGDVDSFRQALADGRPDLIVADQRLPDGTGVDVARLMRAVDARVPLLVVTGDTAPDDIALLRASGLPVLHKPFTSNELWSALQAARRDAS